MLERNRDSTRERCAQARIIDVGVSQAGGGGQGRKRSNISKKEWACWKEIGIIQGRDVHRLEL